MLLFPRPGCLMDLRIKLAKRNFRATSFELPFSRGFEKFIGDYLRDYRRKRGKLVLECSLRLGVRCSFHQKLRGEKYCFGSKHGAFFEFKSKINFAVLMVMPKITEYRVNIN